MILESCSLAGRFPKGARWPLRHRRSTPLRVGALNHSLSTAHRTPMDHGTATVPWWCHDENAGNPDDVLSKRSMSHFADTLMHTVHTVHTVHMVHMVHTIGCRYVIFIYFPGANPPMHANCSIKLLSETQKMCRALRHWPQIFPWTFSWIFLFAWFDIVLDSTCARPNSLGTASF